VVTRCLASLCLLLFCVQLRAECQCLWQGSFAEVQASTELVVSGTVIATKGNSIDLSVDRALRGNPQREAIRVWMKTANYCRPETELFPIGSRWVMALSYIPEFVSEGFNPGTPSISYGRQGDYYLSSCGGFWLSQHGDYVSGNLVKAPRWVREPEMTPVLIDLVAQYVKGSIAEEALLQASREDPELRELMLDTRAFLRGDEDIP